MRLWTLHPRYLDSRGLVAVWREGLLAQKVLEGGTRAYQRHPQLHRFLASGDPATTVASYLVGILEEATQRGYRFDGSKIHETPGPVQIEATVGQLDFERAHLAAKLRVRSPDWEDRLEPIDRTAAHRLFRIVPGPRADWERGL